MIPAILLGVFLSQIVGFSIYFNFERGKIKKQLKTYIKKGVPENELKIFTFSQKEFSSLSFTKKREFKLDGNYYDIVFSSKDSLRNLLLQCVDDMQESVLFRNLSSMIDFNLGNERSDSPLSIMFSLLKTPFNVGARIKFIEYIFILESQKENIFAYKDFQSEAHLSYITSPPDSISILI